MFGVPLIFCALTVFAEPLPKTFAQLELGNVTFSTSTNNTDARDWFLYGLLHLFSFGYDYATPAFQTSRTLDPNFGLAFAFEALTNFWPMWNHDDFAKANNALDYLTNITVEDEREALYISAIQAHFNTSLVTKIERLSAAIEVFSSIVEKFPNDATALAFRGLWNLEKSTLFNEKRLVDSLVQQCIKDCEEALKVFPDHPGAVHYLIHAYDFPDKEQAKNGLLAAQLYPTIVSSASHGLHMPTHIYMRLSLWLDAFEIEERAIVAAQHVCALYNRSEDLSCDMWNLYHSVEYNQYQAYMTGQWSVADEQLARMGEVVQLSQNDSNVQSYLLWWMRMDARQILESDLLWGNYSLERICSLSSVPRLSSGEESWHTEGASLFALGLCAVKFAPNASIPELLGALDRLDHIADPVSEWTGPNRRLRLLLQAFALIHHALPIKPGVGSAFDEAWKLIEEAIKQEDEALTTAGGPTLVVISAHEFAAQILIGAGDASKIRQALDHLQAARLLRGNRLSIVLGEARAMWLAGCPKRAQEKYQAVREMFATNVTRPKGPIYWEEVVSRAQPVVQEHLNCKLLTIYSFGSILEPSSVVLAFLFLVFELF